MNHDNPVTTLQGFTGTVDTTFTDSKVNPTGSKVISLDTEFTSGLSIPEINKGTGDIIYIDNRPLNFPKRKAEGRHQSYIGILKNATEN